MSSILRKIPMKKVLQVIIAILAVVYVVVSFTQIEQIATALQKGNWPFLVLAFLVEGGVLVNTAYTYRAVYRLMGAEESVRQLFKIGTASTFVNIIAPSGGLGGMAYFIASSNREKISSARIMVIGILFVIYEYVSLLFVVVLGFIALIRRNDLNPGEVTAAVLLLLSAVAFTGLLFLANKSAERLGGMLAGVFKGINRLLHRLFHRDLLDPEKARGFALEIGEGISAMHSNRKNLLMPLVLSLVNKGLLITVLMFIFLALDVRFSMGSLVGGYSIGQLFYYVSPTPGGVGVVESIFPVALNLLRVPFTKAVLVTLMYRGVTFWFPFLVGGVTMRLVERQKKR